MLVTSSWCYLSNPTKKKINNKPCENCRRIRKKCERKNNQPCQRCIDSGLQCTQVLTNIKTAGICTNCRQNHRKCNGDGKTPCATCLKNNLQCIYVHKKRGRPVGSSSKITASHTTNGSIISRCSLLFSQISDLIEIYNEHDYPIYGIRPINLSKFDIESFISKRATPQNLFLYSLLANAARRISLETSTEFAVVASEMSKEKMIPNNYTAYANILLILYHIGYSGNSTTSYVEKVLSILSPEVYMRTIIGPLIGWFKLNCYVEISNRNMSSEVGNEYNGITWSVIISIMEDSLFSVENLEKHSYYQLMISFFGYSTNLLLHSNYHQSKGARFITEIISLANVLLIKLEKVSNFKIVSTKSSVQDQLLLLIAATKASLKLITFDGIGAVEDCDTVLSLYKNMDLSNVNLITMIALDQVLDILTRMDQTEKLLQGIEQVARLDKYYPKMKGIVDYYREALYLMTSPTHRDYFSWELVLPHFTKVPLDRNITLIPKYSTRPQLLTHPSSSPSSSSSNSEELEASPPTTIKPYTYNTPQSRGSIISSPIQCYSQDYSSFDSSFYHCERALIEDVDDVPQQHLFMFEGVDAPLDVHPEYFSINELLTYDK